MLALTPSDIVPLAVPSGMRGWARNNWGGSAVGTPGATALLLVGLSSGEEDAVATWTVSANGAIPAAGLTVAVAWTNVPVTGATTSVSLTRTAPTATVSATPTSPGTLTVTVSAAGVSSAATTFLVVTPIPPTDFTQWSVWINAAEAFETNLSNSPGAPLLAARNHKIQLEFDGITATGDGDSIQNVDATDTTGKYNGSTGQKGVTLTATLLSKKDMQDDSLAVVERVNDPGGGGFKVYQHTMHRDFWWRIGRKWRCVHIVDNNSGRHPWGVRKWTVVGFYFTTEMLLDSPTGSAWDMFLSLHQGVGSLILGGGFSLNLVGGDGVLANARFKALRTSYVNPNWRTNAAERIYKSGYIAESNSTWLPSVGWNWFIIDQRQGNGYADPTKGAVYGGNTVNSAYYPAGVFPTGATRSNGSEFFVKLYHATGMSGTPTQRFSYNGFWGGPCDPLDSNITDSSACVTWAGALTSKNDMRISDLGIYQKTNFAPTSAGTTVRTRILTGAKEWMHKGADGTNLGAGGMDAGSVLNAYRNSLA